MLKKTTLLLISLFVTACIANAQTSPADSLARIRFVKTQTSKADSLSRVVMAAAKPGATNAQLNQALNVIDQALHSYSRFRDSTGIRQSFDNMAFIYHLQKKHSQEKWYILQSNTLSRQLADTPNIINSLIRLAAVKHDIKDYSLEAEDLNEALMLSQKIKNKPEGIQGMKAIANVYIKEGDLKIAAFILNRVDELKDSANKQAALKNPHPSNIDSLRQLQTDKAGGNNIGQLHNVYIKYFVYIVLIISIILLITYYIYLAKKKMRK